MSSGLRTWWWIVVLECDYVQMILLLRSPKLQKTSEKSTKNKLMMRNIYIYKYFSLHRSVRYAIWYTPGQYQPMCFGWKSKVGCRWICGGAFVQRLNRDMNIVYGCLWCLHGMFTSVLHHAHVDIIKSWMVEWSHNEDLKSVDWKAYVVHGWYGTNCPWSNLQKLLIQSSTKDNVNSNPGMCSFFILPFQNPL